MEECRDAALNKWNRKARIDQVTLKPQRKPEYEYFLAGGVSSIIDGNEQIICDYPFLQSQNYNVGFGVGADNVDHIWLPLILKVDFDRSRIYRLLQNMERGYEILLSLHIKGECSSRRCSRSHMEYTAKVFGPRPRCCFPIRH